MDVDSEEDATLLLEQIPKGDDTLVDEADIIDVVEKLIVEGKGADTGQFKPGEFQKLADKMNEKFLGCGLTVKHIRNKRKRLKEKHMYVADMLGRSGFGWNSQKMCVEVGHNVMLYTPGKPFLLFEHLGNIFGKDKATGLEACSGKDAEEDVWTKRIEINQGRQTATKKSNDAAILSNLAKNFKAMVQDQGKHVQALANVMSGVNEQVNLGRTLKSLDFDTIEIVQIAKKFVQNP
ncbi:hypothetical protein Ahy_B01g056107 [Arachis hypogaea]|uniref:Myb/SANT-like domain-containing protein n=1 Tax=Arachis hypogaea TaxID=3818 RepID=A0A445AY56_ARAHY|nr:hypothetical protein Ahy_B01g056107 [Arachis hypogaea]